MEEILNDDGSVDFEKVCDILGNYYKGESATDMLTYARERVANGENVSDVLLDTGLGLSLDGGPSDVLNDITGQLLDMPKNKKTI